MGMSRFYPNVSWGKYNSLPDTEKSYWAVLARSKNAHIRIGTDDVQKNLQTYSDRGAFKMGTWSNFRRKIHLRLEFYYIRIQDLA